MVCKFSFSVEHFEKGHVPSDVLYLMADESSRLPSVLLPPNLECEIHKLPVAPLGEVNVLEDQRFLMKNRRLTSPFPLPRRSVRKLVIVAKSLAIRSLALDTKMTAARLTAVECIEAHQLGELEKVGNATCLLERLI